MADNGNKNVNLKEVQIVASRTTNTAEGYVTNLKGSDIAKGKPISAALELLPGITKENGSLKIEGLPVSEIYLNGLKLSDAAELSKLPAELIDKVKVTYLAGSGQSAAMSGGIISITMRKPPQMGYYGVAFGSAQYDKSFGFGNENLGAMIYSRINGLSLYDYANVGWSQFEATSDQSVPGDGGVAAPIKESTHSHEASISNRFSLTQDINKHSTIAGSYYIASNRNRPLSKSSIVDEYSFIRSRNDITTHNATVMYDLTLNDKDATMSISGDYLNRHSSQASIYGNVGTITGNTREHNNVNLWKLSTDFSYPLNQKVTLRWGASAQWLDTKYNPEGFLIGASLNRSHAKGFTPIGYAEVAGMAGRISYAAGFNLQLNRVECSTSEANNHNTQWGIHPTAQLRAPLNKSGTTTIRVSYKRMLDEIPYSVISSERQWSDPMNYTVGNTDLKAMTSDYANVAIGTLRGKLNFSAFYSHIKNWIYWETQQDNNNPEIYYTHPVNVKGYHSFGFRAEWAMKPLKFWQFKLTGRIGIYPENLTLDGVYYGKTRTREFLSFISNFSFQHGWGGSLNSQFEPTFRNYDRTYHSVYLLSLRAYKYLMGNKLQIIVSGTPLGNQRKLDRHLPTGGTIGYHNTTPVENIGVSVNWWFNGGKKVNAKSIENGEQQYNEISDFR